MEEKLDPETVQPQTLPEDEAPTMLEKFRTKKWFLPLIFSIISILFVSVIVFGAVLIQKKYRKRPLPLPTPTPTPILTPSPIPLLSPTPTITITPTPITTPTPTPTGKLKSIGPFEIEIVGDNECVNQTNQALSLLKNKAAVHYNVIIIYIGVIECVEAGSGMFPWKDPPLYKAGKQTREESTIWYAGTIAHDACHSKQYHDYLFSNPSELVPSEVYKGRKAEAQCLDAQYDALSKIGASQDYLNYVKNIIDSEYWDIEYEERWW